MEPITIATVGMVTKILANMIPKDSQRVSKQALVMLISIVLTLGYLATTNPLTYSLVFTAVLNGVIGGATAMGIHEMTKKTDYEDEELAG